VELILAILVGLGIFLVIPVIIGLTTIGIYLFYRRRAFTTERAGLLKGAAANPRDGRPSGSLIVLTPVEA
jgi:hypothetical protein